MSLNTLNVMVSWSPSVTCVLSSPGSQTDQQLELAVLADVPGGGVDGVDIATEGMAGHSHWLRRLLQVTHLIGRLHKRHSLLCGWQSGWR